MKIILCGYMGSGKSVIGRILANNLNWSFVDLDDAIEAEEKITIPEIFSQKGELFFRKKENQVFKKLIEQQGNQVIALGGGTPCYGNNSKLLTKKDVTSFYLKVNLEVLTERLFAEKENRPIIADQITKEKLNDFIRKHLFERQFYYLQSHHTVDCSHKNIATIAEELETYL